MSSLSNDALNNWVQKFYTISLLTISLTLYRFLDRIKALTALVGRLSLSVGWKMVLNGDFRLFRLILHFLYKSKQTVQILIRCRVVLHCLPMSKSILQ